MLRGQLSGQANVRSEGATAWEGSGKCERRRGSGRLFVRLLRRSPAGCGVLGFRKVTQPTQGDRRAEATAAAASKGESGWRPQQRCEDLVRRELANWRTGELLMDDGCWMHLDVTLGTSKAETWTIITSAIYQASNVVMAQGVGCGELQVRTVLCRKAASCEQRIQIAPAFSCSSVQT
jgi:hypothetical protein